MTKAVITMKKLILGWLLFLFVPNAFPSQITGAFGIDLGQSISVYSKDKIVEPGGVFKLDSSSRLVSDLLGIQEYEQFFNGQDISALRSAGRMSATDYKWTINEEVAESEFGYVESELEFFQNGEMVIVFDSEYYPSQISFDIDLDSISNQELDNFFDSFDRFNVTFDIDRNGYATNLVMTGVIGQLEEYESFFGYSFRKAEIYLFRPTLRDKLFDHYEVGVSAISKKAFEISASKEYELNDSSCLDDFATMKFVLDSKYRGTKRVNEKRLIAVIESFGGKSRAVEAYRSNGRGIYLSCVQHKDLGSETLELSYFDHTMGSLIDEEFKEYQLQEKSREARQLGLDPNRF